MKTLSIIVPIYNIENYIEKCLDSLSVEEVLGDIEVLMMNDGSKDRSAALAAAYQDRYPDTFRLITKENGGHGSTINQGIIEATGKYFKVVDGDDWVEREAFINLVSYLKTTDTDMVLSNYYWVDHVTGAKKAEVKELCTDIEYKKVYRFSDIMDRLFLKMHAITIKTDILLKMGERIDEHCFYVDAEYMLFPIPYVQSVAFLKDYVYQYRVGMTTQSMNIKNMQKRCGQHEKVLNRLLEYYARFKDTACAPFMAKTIARIAVSQYKIYLSFTDSHKPELVSTERKLKQNYPEIYKAVSNTAILMLRWTSYVSYPLVSFLVSRLLGGE